VMRAGTFAGQSGSKSFGDVSGMSTFRSESPV